MRYLNPVAERVVRRVLASSVLAASVCAQGPRAIYTAHGDVAGDFLGHAVAACGDVDRDGKADVLAGAPYADTANGVNSGSARVLSATGAVIWSFAGGATDDLFGHAVAGAGDVNRDGYPDLLVGAPGDDNRGADSGSARVYSGFDGSVLYAIDGDFPGDECGYAVGAGGDIDRDGYADFIVGLHRAETPRRDAGIARVYSGRDGHVIYELRGLREDDHFGAWVGEVGDVNRDGWTDFMITAPWADIGFLKSGTATVFSGRDGSILHNFYGDGGGHEMGTACAKCGDVDGDGYADLFIAEPEHRRFGDDSGSVKLYSGRTGALLLQLYGTAPYEYFGLTIGAGDFDADGVPDLVVGAFLEDTGAPNGGAIYVYSGATFARIFAAHGSVHSDQLGRGVDFVGDVNGDGIGDIAAGIPAFDIGSEIDMGAVRTYCGAPTVPATYTYGTGCPAAQPFGLAFTGIPSAGSTVQFQLTNGPVIVPMAWVVLAARNQPPLDLTAAGMTGCTLYQPLDLLVPMTLNAGAGSLPLRVPEIPTVCGMLLFTQAVGWEPGINPLGVITSNAGRIALTN